MITRDLTTGEVARLSGLGQQHVVKCIDRGLLPARRVPGSKHRRVTRAALVKFLQTHNMPVPSELRPAELEAPCSAQ